MKAADLDTQFVAVLRLTRTRGLMAVRFHRNVEFQHHRHSSHFSSNCWLSCVISRIPPTGKRNHKQGCVERYADNVSSDSTIYKLAKTLLGQVHIPRGVWLPKMSLRNVCHNSEADFPSLCIPLPSFSRLPIRLLWAQP